MWTWVKYVPAVSTAERGDSLSGLGVDQIGVSDQVPEISVYRHEVFRPGQIQHDFEFFLTGVARGMEAPFGVEDDHGTVPSGLRGDQFPGASLVSGRYTRPLGNPTIRSKSGLAVLRPAVTDSLPCEKPN